MLWQKAQWQEYAAKARRILVRIPRISNVDLGKQLSIDPRTASKLKKMIREQNVRRINKQKVESEVGKLEGEFEEIAMELWRIIGMDKKEIDLPDGTKKTIYITEREKVEAVKALGRIKKDLFNIKFDAGVFSRKIGEIDLRKSENILDKLIKNLDDDTRQKVISELEKLAATDESDGNKGNDLSEGLGKVDRSGDLPKDGGNEGMENGGATSGVEPVGGKV
jgi:hypothetical protein